MRHSFKLNAGCRHNQAFCGFFFFFNFTYYCVYDTTQRSEVSSVEWSLPSCLLEGSSDRALHTQAFEAHFGLCPTSLTNSEYIAVTGDSRLSLCPVHLKWTPSAHSSGLGEGQRMFFFRDTRRCVSTGRAVWSWVFNFT